MRLDRRVFATAFLTALLATLCACNPAMSARLKVRGKVEVVGPPNNEITILYLKGTPYERGYAHGKLCEKDVASFLTLVQKSMLAGMKCDESVLDRAYAAMEPFIPQAYKDEMKGLADGAGVPLKLVHEVHAIPELSEYHCTFVAATGKATPDGHTYQLRALDYATRAHIQDHPAIIVSQPRNGVPFVSVGWCGFVGIVTGVNSQEIAMSQIGDHFGDECETLQGEPMVFVMRDVLTQARTMSQAIRVIREARRTSSYLYCLGAAKSHDVRALTTCKDFCKVYDSETLPFPFPILKGVVYMSMGWDSDWNKKVFKCLRPLYGKIDANAIMKNVSMGLGTGDLQSVVFDVTAQKMWVANAGKDGTPAFKRVFVPVDVKELFKKLRHVH